jgi:Peptidase family M1 domain
VTKVLLTKRALLATASALIAVFFPFSALASAENPQAKPAETLYLQLGQVGLDPTRVYQVRGASLDRSAVHISLDDGTIGFTQDVLGRISGAFFEGDGEVLIVPPTDVERKSMSLFTGMAILEEHFSTAYFRFDDDVPAELRPGLRATDNKQAFVDHWQATARNLAPSDAMRLLESLSGILPTDGNAPSPEMANANDKGADRFLHARLQGNDLGVFDIYYDSLAREQVEVGQARMADNGITYYNVWTSFSAPATPAADKNAEAAKVDQKPQEDWITISHYTIKAEVQPPKQIRAQARVELEVKQAKSRVMFFELSRFLQVESVKLAGQPLEFIHNPAVEGTQLARKGDDIMAVILPEPPVVGQKIELDFVYGGEVLAEAGSGLLYVGARGTWYPNRGMAMANFDLEFRYPSGWTLVATGKPSAVSADELSKRTDGLETSHWISERPIPFAGFDLGKYKEFKTMAGDVSVETFATGGVERGFPSAPIEAINQKPLRLIPPTVQVIAPNSPSPSRNEVSVGESAARAIQYYAERFGPFPYSQLALTQLPGPESQGWPGLVFLSSYAFLNEREREDLHYDHERILLQESIPAHETAHQWWGDLVGWDSYRDQWFSEGLSNYCALMMLQDRNPAGFREIMDKYRRDLLEKNKQGVAPMEAGPVTLGTRLLSSRFPGGYEAISYGRATWLFHMLRSMLKDSAPEDGMTPADEPFVRALRKLRERFQGKSISTQDLMDAFAEELPASLRYEGKKSLDWFLEGWVNGTSLPRLELKAVKFTPKGSASVVTGTILQQDAPEDLVTSVPVYAVMSGKQVFLARVFADGEESTFHLNAPAGVRKIVLDPNETVLTSLK